MINSISESPQEASTEPMTSCDREPIHVPGAILPHGAMLVLDCETLEILQAAGNIQGLLRKSFDELLGKSVGTLIDTVQMGRLKALNEGFDLLIPRHLLDPLMRVVPDCPLDASVHRSGATLVVEFEAADISERFFSDPLAGVQEMIRGLDVASSLQSLCQLAAERVRNIAGYDRVLVYRFMQDESGWVIAESRDKRLEPFLDLHYPAADIPKQARVLYLKSWLRMIAQVNYDPAPLTPALNPHSGLPLDMSYAILRDLSPVHREYLRNMGVDASLSISIIQKGKLWGLIVCHHYTPKILPRHLRAVFELFGSMFSLQLESWEREEQFEARLASRMMLQNMMLNLAGADDYAKGLTQQSPTLLDYIHSAGQDSDRSRSGGVAVCIKGRLTFLGVTPERHQIESLIAWLDTRMPAPDGVFSTDRLGESWLPAKEFASVGAGVLVISVSPEPSDYIIWFRPEIVTSVQWAGQPSKLVQPNPDGLSLSPRKSFEAWKETVVGRGSPWIPADIEAAFDLRLSLLHVVLRRIESVAQERKKAVERDQLLMAELDHRVKNTLANIQALVIHTSRSAESLTGFVEGLDGRLQSMAKAHSLLSQSRWEGVSIEKLLREELNPYGKSELEILLSGPDFVLTPKSALSLSLAIHELATNAAKYGSLSHPEGHVAVSWTPAGGGGVNIAWSETGGPPVETPIRRGFGSTLIERALAMETGGRAVVRYLPTGVICDIFLPSSSVLSSEEVVPLTVQTAAVAPVCAADAEQRPYRILVVEDSFLVVSALEDLFQEFGWTTVGPATRVVDALVLARTEKLDAALLDVNLNGEMSWDVALALKERGVPFLFSTGYGGNVAVPAQLAGTQVISKPFDLDELERRMRDVIDQSRKLARGSNDE
jgi:chemotaxis family two-component system sensor kinase Cph1